MLIDWFTTGAQIVNFLLLVYLLKRFLYRPIVLAMEKREEMIVQRLDEAEKKHSEAVQEVVSYHEKIQELDLQRDEIMARYRDEAEEQKQQMIRKARAETDNLKDRWLETVREEQDAFLHTLRLRAGMQVCVIASRLLTDLADSSLEQRMLERFLHRTKDLDPATLDQIRNSLQKEQAGVIVTSSFELLPAMQEAIIRDIHSRLTREVPVSFMISPSLICGIELKAGGYVVGWSLQEYLKTIEDEARTLFEQGSGTARSGSEA